MAIGNQFLMSTAETDIPDQELDMSSLPPSALASVDDSLALPFASVEQLRAANSIDIEEIIQQLEAAAESAQALRALISEELPEASWQNREELDALLEKIQKPAEPSNPVESPSPVLTPETEFEPDAVVQTGSTLPAMEYTAQTSGELVGTNPCFMETRSTMSRCFPCVLKLTSFSPGSAESRAG